MDKTHRELTILFILPEYYPHSGGGISTYYLHYIKALKPFCERIKVVVGSGYVQRDETHMLEGVEIEYLGTGLYKNYLSKFSKFNVFGDYKRNLAAAWAMHEQVNEGNDFDMIECTDFGLGFVPWVIKHNKPVITRLHGSTGQVHLHESGGLDNVSVDFVRQTELLLLPAADQLITHSSANQKFWNEAFGNQRVVRIDPVFYAGTAKPIPLAARENYGLVTARIQRWKGPVALCEAMSRMDGPEIPHIRWLGRDMPYDNGQSMAQFLTSKFPAVWGKRVLPGRPLGNEQIRALQAKVKFGLVPSTWDMFNFTSLEFLGSGTPLICSDGAGCSDLIRHGENGFKYRAKDTLALADCLRQVSRMNDREFNKIVTAGLETINTELSGDKLIPVNMGQYKKAVDNFIVKKPNPFLATIYQPTEQVHPVNDILDNLPLKSLINYVAKRVKSKIGAKRV